MKNLLFFDDDDEMKMSKGGVNEIPTLEQILSRRSSGEESVAVVLNWLISEEKSRSGHNFSTSVAVEMTGAFSPPGAMTSLLLLLVEEDADRLFKDFFVFVVDEVRDEFRLFLVAVVVEFVDALLDEEPVFSFVVLLLFPPEAAAIIMERWNNPSRWLLVVTTEDVFIFGVVGPEEGVRFRCGTEFSRDIDDFTIGGSVGVVDELLFKGGGRGGRSDEVEVDDEFRLFDDGLLLLVILLVDAMWKEFVGVNPDEDDFGVDAADPDEEGFGAGTMDRTFNKGEVMRSRFMFLFF